MIETKNKITSDMNIKRIAIAMMLIITTAGYSQVFTVSGIVEDNQTGKALKDVSVTLPDQRTFTTNSSGFFSFELTTREMPMMLKFTTPEYLKSTYKVERARFNRNRELWLNIKMHPIDSSKVFVSEEEIICIEAADSDKVRRILARANLKRTNPEVIDTTSDKETRSIIFLKDNKYCISSVNASILTKRAQSNSTEVVEEN